MTPEEARAHVAREDARLATLEQQMRDLASRQPAAIVFAMLEVIVAAMAGRPEFVTHTRIRIYSAVLQNLAQKGSR